MAFPPSARDVPSLTLDAPGMGIVHSVTAAPIAGNSNDIKLVLAHGNTCRTFTMIGKEACGSVGDGIQVDGTLRAAVWDPYSQTVFAAIDTGSGSIIVQKVDDATWSIVAGQTNSYTSVDGCGNQASFDEIRYLVSDSRGKLFAAEQHAIRALKLPVRMRYGQGKGGHNSGETDEVVVTTLHTLQGSLRGLTVGVSPMTGAAAYLYCADERSLYRTRINLYGGDGVGSLEFVAGLKGALHLGLPPRGYETDDDDLSAETGRIFYDGYGTYCSFSSNHGIVGQADGSIIIMDGVCVRCLEPDGKITTLCTGLQGPYRQPYITPSGQLALCHARKPAVLLLDLGLSPVPLIPPTPVGLEPDDMESPSPLVRLMAGGSTFYVKRAVLCKHSPYLQACLGGGFAEAQAEQLGFPGIDSSTMQALVEWINTGTMPSMRGASLEQLLLLARAADELNMEPLFRELLERVMEWVGPENIVDVMLWAEQCTGRFVDLLSMLKAWFIEHEQKVVANAAESVQRLQVENTALSAELRAAANTRQQVRRESRLVYAEDPVGFSDYSDEQEAYLDAIMAEETEEEETEEEETEEEETEEETEEGDEEVEDADEAVEGEGEEGIE
ncbi:hypothetical protein HYH03_008172 [Edaphochlamys debaryana]|uniref:BTB domain-containing protein n=1 Tax=Edaphochlamys debaryana TaxID=47281 RepID=A0A835Y1T9_9CHLO|nr:hypothetical protein HYH03_008172 [Edaphochlamys debaryana]|eukprot:KAG2493657.1 hypothetical protein HYH03_008172 [Edaphochlamys debaryana]